MSAAPDPETGTMVLRAILQLDEKIEALSRRVDASSETLGQLETKLARLAEAQEAQGRALAELLARQDLVARALKDVQGEAE
jgi:hypothetical protein